MKVGILGFGSIGERHAHNATALGHEVFCYDPILNNQETRESILKKCDAIVIASPTNNHFDDLLAALAVDKPILIEKPIVNRQIDLYRLKSKDLSKVMVGYNQRFNPAVIRARGLVGVYGPPKWGHFVCSQYNSKPAYLRDGVIFNWSHEIDLALFLMGKGSVTCASVISQNGNDVMADINIQHDNDRISSIHLDYLTMPEVRNFTVAWEAVVASVDIPKRSISITGFDGETEQKFFNGSVNEDYVAEMKTFLSWADGGFLYGCNAYEALDVAEICLEAKQYACRFDHEKRRDGRLGHASSVAQRPDNKADVAVRL